MKNLRLFIVAVLAIMLFVPTSGCSEQRTESERLEAAFAEYQSGRYRAAFIELKNLLQVNPSNKDARLLLGRASLQMGDAPSAEKEFARAQELGATPDEFYALSLQARLMQGRHKEIIDDFDLTGMTIEDNRQIAQVFYGNALFNAGQISEAEGQLRSVIEATTSDEPLRRAYLGLAEVMRAKGDLPGAIEMAQKSAEFGPDSAETAAALGQLLLATKDFTGAREQFSRARQSVVASANERFVSAAGEVEAALGLGDIDEAKRAGNRLFELSPEHPITGYLLGRVAFVAGDKNAAYERLQGVLAKFPQFRPAQVLQGALSLERKEFEQAEMFLSSVVAAEPGNREARKLLAETRLQLKNPEGAARVLREALDAGAGDQQMIGMLGRASMQAGDKSAAILQLEKSLAAFPQNGDLRIALAAAYVSNGQTAKAIETINAIKDGDATDKRRDMLRLLVAVQEKNIDEANAQAQALATKWPDDRQVNNLVGGWFFSQGEYDSARPYFEAILVASPSDINALTNLGRIDLQQKNFAQARARYQAFLKREPDNQAGLLSLAYVYQAEGDSENALTSVKRAHQVDPTAELPAVILARIYLFNKDYAKALEMASTAVAASPRSAMALQTKGKVLLQTGKYDDALSAFAQAAKLAPDDKSILHNKAQTELVQKQFAQARGTYEAIWALDTTDLQAARNLAVLEIRAGRANKAEAILEKLQSAGLNRAVVVEIEGDIRRENKDTTRALDAYRQAYKLQPSRSVALKLHNLQPQDSSDKTVHLRNWLEYAPQDYSVRLLLAQLYQKMGRQDQAIEEYEKIVQQRPDNSLVLNNLAWIYYEQPDSDAKIKALDMARKANELTPGVPQIMDTYGWILLRSGQADEGTRLLAEAEAIAEKSGSSSLNDITYHHAVALNEGGNRSAAKSRLQKILNSNADFSSRADAKLLLETLQR